MVAEVKSSTVKRETSSWMESEFRKTGEKEMD